MISYYNSVYLLVTCILGGLLFSFVISRLKYNLLRIYIVSEQGD
jgi:hypothetical protein